MSYQFRLLNTGFNDCYWNMGLDEALLETVSSGGMPALRFYGWKPPAVSVGYFQSIEEEIDSDACRKAGFDIVRRISGGGAVLHKSELTYSIALPLIHPLAKSDLNESYQLLGAALIKGFSLLGIGAEFSGINDIVSGGKKISGNAQTRRRGEKSVGGESGAMCILQHGTVLLDNDIDEMFSVLKVPKEKLSGAISEAKERVTSAKTVLGKEVPFEEAAAAFAEGFTKALGLNLLPSKVSAEEDSRARRLAAEKFSAREWIYKR
jgi:lipoate-protein ligase A